MKTQHIVTPTYRITTRSCVCAYTGELFTRSIIVLKDVNGDILDIEHNELLTSNEYSFMYTRKQQRTSNFNSLDV